ncbi:MAG: Nif3-like dinuclear metal center hexameric protein [Anaerolineae bacterium]|jgi:dinuclear metal center YbgI/SA1388 family protein
MKRYELVAYLNEFLDVEAIQDRSNNGLQVEGAGEVEHLALAVDAGLAAFEGARHAGAQMLIVHHGLFWGEPLMITGIHRRRLKVLLDAEISLYAVHLPLDFHGEVGNNATLARWLALEETGGFGDYKGQPAGVAGTLATEMSLEAFTDQVAAALDEPVVQVWPFGHPRVRRVGIVSGGAGSLVDQAAEAGVDVYLTGEVSHSVYHQARELGLNVVFGGHYATETAGLKALAGHLAERFHLETTFLDLPTGA